MDKPPTLDEIRQWPATCSVTEAAKAIGVSRSQFYDLVRSNQCPVRFLKVGTIRVVTASLIRLLEDADN